jgi:DNA repair protein SbcD/Mre11
MRILHTSDWHLGKRLFKLDRSEEHAQFLDWLISTILVKEIDLLLIAGDIFDTPTPPHHSLEMFYNFLHRLSVETTTQTLIIAGNHDSGLLLEAPARLLTPHRVKIWGKLSSEVNDHWLEFEKAGEKLAICGIPFFRSYELLPHGDGDALVALKTYLSKPKRSAQLLMLHHLAGIFEAAGSEQVINLSGVESIPIEMLESFDYVALGHIHKPQKIGKNSFYSGSPLPMRFSETHPKSVRLLNLKQGQLTSETHAIPVIRPLHLIRANEENWRKKISELEASGELTPMVEVQMTLQSPQVGLIDEIKKELVQKGMELLSYLPSYSSIDRPQERHERLFELSPLEIFQQFYAHKYPDAQDMPPELELDFKELLQKVNDASSET